MRWNRGLLSVLLIFFSSIFTSLVAERELTPAVAKFIRHRQLLNHDDCGRRHHVDVDASLVFPNPRLRSAYIALQAWKRAILSDPYGITSDWVGSQVCSYTGVFCSDSLHDSNVTVVSGIDINSGDIAGYLPEELGLLEDLALFHINSNRFCGTLPNTFDRMKLLYELDLSNNRFVGKFPEVVLRLPSLRYLDLRFNEFEGRVPRDLFYKNFDAIFINNNRFSFQIPDNLGASPVSVLVLEYGAMGVRRVGLAEN